MKRNRIPALLLAMLLTLLLSVSAFAAGSTTATVPVTLTVDKQYRAVNVTRAILAAGLRYQRHSHHGGQRQDHKQFQDRRGCR